MSFKDRVSNDINVCFMRTDHFAEKHFWNGKQITCVTDEEAALKRKNNNVNDISWDNNNREILLHTPLDTFPEGDVPEPNTQVLFDEKLMYITSVVVNMGVLGIYMSARDPREIY